MGRCVVCPFTVCSTGSICVLDASKFQALVYGILPSTTAVFSYVIGSWKLSANEKFFVAAQTSKFVTNNSNKTRRVIYSRQQSLHQRKQNHNRLNRDGKRCSECGTPGVYPNWRRSAMLPDWMDRLRRLAGLKKSLGSHDGRGVGLARNPPASTSLQALLLLLVLLLLVVVVEVTVV